MADSEPGASAAMFGRSDRFPTAPSGYRFLLPTIPAEDSMKTCLILHCDLGGRPYRIEDFRAPFHEMGVLKDIAGIGPFQMGHVWLIKLKTPEARLRLVHAGGLRVKGRYCAVIDPIQQEVTIKLHWVPFHVPDASIRRVFTEFGEVNDVRQDAWGAAGFETAESTTRLVRMTLREDLTTDDLPHMFKFYGGSVLVVVPGRAPQCLRCKRRGHIRKDCRTPRCSKCKLFGHLSDECVRTYANVTGTADEPEVHPEVMDEEEAERAAASTALAVTTEENEVKQVNGDGQQTPLQNTKVCEEQTANGSQVEPQSSDGVASTAETTKDTPLVQQQEGSADDDDAVSLHSCVSTRTQHSAEYLTEDENTKAQSTARRDASAKRRRDATQSEERRLVRLEKEWKISTKKKGKFESHQPRSQSATRSKKH